MNHVLCTKVGGVGKSGLYNGVRDWAPRLLRDYICLVKHWGVGLGVSADGGIHVPTTVLGVGFGA